jgi:DNA-binding Lrp family transcriptional regulator
VAYSLISAELSKLAEVLNKVRKVKGVRLAECVTGPYDIVARVEAETMEDLTKADFLELRGIEGVASTVTLIVVEA